MLTIRPETEPALRWAREISDVIDETAYRLFTGMPRVRVSLENCLEKLRIYGCETKSPFAPIDVDKCETVIAHEKGCMFVWFSRNAGESTSWINGGLFLHLPPSMHFISDDKQLIAPAVIQNRLIVEQPPEIVHETLCWSTHT